MIEDLLFNLFDCVLFKSMMTLSSWVKLDNYNPYEELSQNNYKLVFQDETNVYDLF